jgi:hypothetical protein
MSENGMLYFSKYASQQEPVPAMSPTARDWARHLLTVAGCRTARHLDDEHDHEHDDEHGSAHDGEAARWAACGGLALTGEPDGPPLAAPAALATAADGAALALRTLGVATPPDGAALLGERAALLGLRRRGRVSAGGSTRLLRARDGWVALGLRRPADVELVPALVGDHVAGDPWDAVARWLADQPATAAVERATWLNLPAGTPPGQPRPAPPVWRIGRLPGQRAPTTAPLVVDLSALWAGPLATSFLLAAGARVVRLEHPDRLDGTRRLPAFDALLNHGKESVVACFDSRLVRRLLRGADLVVTSARPRALERLGVTPEAAGTASWLTITGYGRSGPLRNRPAYGDEAAVAAGLVAGTPERPVFCADAVADPLTGLHAAVAALAVLRRPGRHHVDVALHDVCAAVLGALPATGVLRQQAAARPRARPVPGPARSPGADNATYENTP